MAILLRIVGTVWILLTATQILQLIRSFLTEGIHVNLGLTDLLTLLMFGGGIGLLLLKDWGRWVLILGSAAFLILLTGPSLLQFKIGPVVLRHLVFYGIFIALLLLPPAKSVTRG